MITYLITVGILIALAGVGVYFLQQRTAREIAENAGEEYNFLQQKEAALLTGLDEAGFRRLYAKAEMPRTPKYYLGAITALLLGTPIALALLAGGANLMKGSVEEPPSEVFADRFIVGDDGTITTIDGNATPDILYYMVQDFAGFYYFFGLLGFWALIVWLFLRAYYKNKPGSLRDEILRAR